MTIMKHLSITAILVVLLFVLSVSLVYAQDPWTNGYSATLVIGQPDFITVNDGTTATTLRDCSSVAPGRMGGYRPRLIAGDHAAWLRARMAADDFTLRGLVAELAERGLKVDYRTVWNFVHREDLSFKKNRSGKRAGPA